MNKDYFLSLLVFVFFQCLAEYVKLIIQHLGISHACCIVQQLVDVQVDFYNIIFYFMLFFLQFGRSIGHTFLQQGFLDIVGRNIHLLYFFIIAHDIVYQSRFCKEIGLLESMQFIEFYGINAHFRIDGILQQKRTVVLVSQQLYRHMFHAVQRTFIELFQVHFHVWLDSAATAQCPAFSFGRQVQIIDEIIAVVYQISVESCRRDCLYILRHISQIYVQHIVSTYFRSTVSNRFFFFYFLFRLRNFRLFGRFKRNIVIICLNDDTLFYQHRNLKAIVTLYQCHVFSLKSSHDTASHFAEKTDFISYFHRFVLLILYYIKNSL